MNPQFRNKIFLLAILCVGLFLRVYDLAGESLWLDEDLSRRVAQLPLIQIVTPLAGEPALYHLFLRFWIALFGDSVFAMRGLSVLFSFCALVMVYKISRLVFDEETGLMSAGLVAISVFHIRYAQEVRMYSCMSFLALCSVFYFLQMCQKRRFQDTAGYVFSSILLIHVHALGILIVCAQNFFLISSFLFKIKNAVKFRPVFRSWVFSQFLLAPSCLQWISWYCFKQTPSGFAGGNYNWIPSPSGMSLGATFLEFSGSVPLTVVFLGLALFSFLPRVRKKTVFQEGEDWIRVNFVGFWFIVPLMVMLVVSFLLQPIYWSRYAIGGSFGLFIAAAWGIHRIQSAVIKRLVLFLCIILSLLSLNSYYKGAQKEPWRDMIHDIEVLASPNDALIFIAGRVIHDSPFFYYSRRKDMILSTKLIGNTARGILFQDFKKVSTLIEGKKKFWLVVFRPSSQLFIASDFNSNLPFKEYLNKNGYDLIFSREYLRERFVVVPFMSSINSAEVVFKVYYFERKL